MIQYAKAKKIKPARICKSCGSAFKSSMQKRTCSPCQVKERRQKKEDRAKRKLDRKVNSKGYQKKQFTKTKRLCDKLWRQAAIDAYGDKCVVCGKEGGVNMHHIISRANKAVRWYVPNAVPLCAGHHVYFNDSAHQNPLWFRKFMVDSRGYDWEKDLLERAQEAWNKDIVQVNLYLTKWTDTIKNPV